VLCDGRIVADHERVWAKHQTVHDPSTSRPPQRCDASGLRSCAHRLRLRSRPDACLTTTRCAVSMAGWRDGHQHTLHGKTRTPRPECGGRVFDPRAESTNAAAVGRPARPASSCGVLDARGVPDRLPAT
jgi:hypothetical protein